MAPIRGGLRMTHVWSLAHPASALLLGLSGCRNKHASAWRRARRALPYYAGLASVTFARYLAGHVPFETIPFLPYSFLSLSPFEDIFPLEHVATYAPCVQALNTRWSVYQRLEGGVHQRPPTASGGLQFNVIPGIFRY